MKELIDKINNFLDSLGVARVPPPPLPSNKEKAMNMTPNICGDCQWFHVLFEKLKDIGECYYYPPTPGDIVKISKDRNACSKFKRKERSFG